MLPTIVVVHGEDALDWLENLRALLSSDPDLRPLLEANLVQFWAWDVESEARSPEELTCLAHDTSPVDVRDVLDRGRRADLRATFHVDLKTVLVLERWSPIRTDAGSRAELHRALDLASRANCLEGKPNLFDYEWTGLVDAVRGPGSLTPEEHEAVRAHFEGSLVECAQLFVDREDCDLGRLNSVHADRALAHAATALISANAAGDGLLPRLQEDLTQRKQKPQRLVLPISVTVFRHGVAQAHNLAAESIAERLSHGEIPYLKPPAKSLADTFLSQLDQIRHGNVSLNSHAFETNRSAAEFLAWFIASVRRAPDTGSAELQELKRCMSAHPHARSVRPKVRSPAEGLPWWRRLLQRVMAFFGRRRNAPEVERTSGTASEADVGELAEELHVRWRRSVAALERTMREWRSYVLGAVRRPVSRAEEAWSGEDGIWVLTGEPVRHSVLAPLTKEDLIRISEISLRQRPSSESSPDFMSRVFHEVAAAEGNEKADGFLIESLKDAFLRCQPEFHRRMTGKLMANTGTPLDETRVLWFFDPASLPASALEELEGKSESRTTTTVHTSDRGASFRLGLASPVPWSDIVSLQPPPESGT